MVAATHPVLVCCDVIVVNGTKPLYSELNRFPKINSIITILKIVIALFTE